MICISLAGLSFQECIKEISKTEFAEIRIDQLAFTESQFGSLFAIKRNTIATCRPGTIDDNRRKALLKQALDSGAGYIDIEYEAPEDYRRELIDYAHSKNAIAILSYHNFDETPDQYELETIIANSKHWGANRVKIATMAHSKADNARMLSLYVEHPHLIAFCMGEMGAITRVAAPLLGAEFTYAAINHKLATAPGQLTVGQLLDIYDILT